MTAKTSDWRPGPTVCRCCLAEGCYKDISTEYFWMGKREVYAEMLSETMSVSIAYSKAGGPNSNSRLICEPCISRLRDASDFKRQVQECEKTFMNYLDAGTSGMQKDESIEEVKIERVKLEKQNSDDDDGFDDEPAVDFIIDNNDDDDDDDDLDDEPLMKLATKVPKKELDVQDLIDNTVKQQLVAKRKTPSKAKEPPAKKAKKQITLKAKPAPKAATSTAKDKTEKKKKEQRPPRIERRNAHKVIEYTTAYPFRLPEDLMACSYCGEKYDDPYLFRQHMLAEHQDFKMYNSFFTCPDYSLIKVDITDLKCRICSVTLDTLNDAARHVKEKHGKKIDLSRKLDLIPFKFEKGKYTCAMCPQKFADLRLLSKHCNSHFIKYTCELCGKSYSTSAAFQIHTNSKCGTDYRPSCRRCKTSFSSVKERRDHLMTSKICCQHLCNVCFERFPTWSMKQVHMRALHDAPAKIFTCPECNVQFTRHYRLRDHFTLEHTENHLRCNFCDMKFASNNRLKRHVATHSSVKQFNCDVCFKSFSSKDGLHQHMWIHSEVKMYSCKICNKDFNQRIGWKTHMKSLHPEFKIV